ncbi:MAG: nitroreductase family protein [Armatimonadota bacterium]
MLRNLVVKSRSYRKYKEDYKINDNILDDLVDITRFCPSAGNLQSLKYYVANTPETCNKIFETLSWAGYYTDWNGPSEGERPTAYIVICGDTNISKNFFCDYGITAQTMLLAAVEKGLGGCIFGSIQREKLRENLSIPNQLEILIVVAIGMPDEEVILEDIKEDACIKYYRDTNGVHHVPKRKLDDIRIKI